VVTVGTAGSVHIFYEELSRPGQPIRLFVVSSGDDGRSFTRAELIGSAPWPPRAGGGPNGNTNTPPPLVGAATDRGSTRSAAAISGQDPRAGHPVIYLWQSPGTSGRWHGPGHPVPGAGAAVTQVQPRIIYVNRRLYLSCFAITRSGQVNEQLVHQTAAGDFQPQALNSTPFRAAEFIGDYQALATTGQTAYAVWNDAVVANPYFDWSNDRPPRTPYHQSAVRPARDRLQNLLRQLGPDGHSGGQIAYELSVGMAASGAWRATACHRRHAS
jgi:hypothetical protein